MTEDLNKEALFYHRFPTAGKLQVVPTKPLANQHDLSLAYSPGVAAACLAIADDEGEAANLTGRGNLVAVISNGTAVLGLGNIGPLASKPVMEGKGALFKKFAGINVYDIEINEHDPDKIVDIVASLEPTFGGINLEDIKAPECFYIESKLRERMNIPVFHDDQHGTAIIAAAAILNGLRVVDKKIEEVRLVTVGAGAAGIACLDILVGLGVKKENIILCDSRGVIYKGRNVGVDARKAEYAADTQHRTAAEAVVDADIFLGVSGPGVLSEAMLQSMADKPLILALANPEPEIRPELAQSVRPDAIIATGRSDYPNQVNNVLCFPFMFRGALDVGATTINEPMKLAAVRALADLAMVPPSEEVVAAYGGQSLSFGADYLIPKPFDNRLILKIPEAVARAAMDSGVATRPIEDFSVYREQLSRYVFRSGLAMKPVFERAKADPKRILYAEGEEERVLQAVQVVLDEKLAQPILIGRRDRVEKTLQKISSSLKIDEDFQLIDPFDNPYYKECWQEYHRLLERQGVDPSNARIRVNTRTTALGAILVKLGYADAMLCGVIGSYQGHLKHVREVIGVNHQVKVAAAMNMLISTKGTLFFCDTSVNLDPSAEELADITLMAAEQVRLFGITPKVALLSHSNFGSNNSQQARKMAEVLQIVRNRDPELEIEGEMQGDVALSFRSLQQVFPNTQLQSEANLLIMPNLDAANISFNLIRKMVDGVAVGPIIMGLDSSAHVLPKTTTVRRIVNMTAVAVADAQIRAQT